MVPILGPGAALGTPLPPPFADLPAQVPRARTALIAAAGVVMTAGAGLVIYRALARDRGAPPRDVAFELPVIQIEGTVRAPDALLAPWVSCRQCWPALNHEVHELERQRAAAARAGDPAQRRAQAIVLAARLYSNWIPWHTGVELARLSDDAQAQLSEARELLRGVVRGAPDPGSDETALRLLGACDVRLADYPAAETTWRMLVERFPDSKDEPSHRAWLIHALLAQSKTAEAFAAAAGERRDPQHPELAYFTAWARWRTGDAAGAWQSLATAVQRWDEANEPCRNDRHTCIATRRYSAPDAPEDDVRWLASAADIGLDGVGPVLGMPDLARGGPPKWRGWPLFNAIRMLGLRYAQGGRWTSAIAALDRAVAALDNHLPADLIAVRAAQAEFAVRLDAPEIVVKHASEAIDAFALCGAIRPALATTTPDKWNAAEQRARSEWDAEQRAACVSARVDAVKRLSALAQVFYDLHSIASDPRYGQATRALYTMVIPLLENAATRARAQDELTAVQAPRAERANGAGSSDAAALRELLVLHDEEISACYEARLAVNPVLSGAIGLTLEVDATGAVQGVETQPAAGSAELPAVARCTADRARRWKLPALGASRTRIALRYALSIKTT